MIRNLTLALAAAALAGCSASPFDYHSQREIPPGPGMFSGEQGAFVWRREGAAAEAQEQREFREWRRDREEARSAR